MNGIILAGGKGTRMANVSDLPKVLLPINNKPIIEHVILKLIEYNVEKIFITLSNSESLLDDWIRNCEYSNSLEAIKDSKEVKGNSYGVIKAMKMSTKTTLLAYGDTIFDFDITDMVSTHMEKKNDITMLVRHTDHPADSDLVWYDNGELMLSKYPHSIKNLDEKYGVSAFYIIEPGVLDNISHSSFSDWFSLLVNLNSLGKRVGISLLQNGYIKDLGTPERYNKVFKMLSNDNI